MRANLRLFVILGLCGLPLWLPAYAGDAESAYNRVNLQVEESREVDNDQMLVTLAVEEENRDAAELASRINNVMLDALQRVRRLASVQSQSGSYRISPIYETDARLKRWKGSQTLFLRSADMPAVSALVGELQEHLKVKSMTFSVAEERRRVVEAELTDAALDAFRARAQRVATRLGFSAYRIVNLNISSQGDSIRPMVMRDTGMAQLRAPVEVEAGRSRLLVTVHGSIELTGNP